MSNEDSTAVLGPRASIRKSEELLAPGLVVGDYELTRCLGKGGCGTVFEAVHRVIGRRAALKVLHRELAESPEMVERFVREARAANLIQHPAIVNIYDFGRLQDGRPYFVMELLDGRSLEEHLRSVGRIDLDEAIEILEPVCDALEAAHRAGVIHRDVKAANISISARNGRWQARLLDFGIAKLTRPDPSTGELTTANQRLGTPSAMAPEQILGDIVDARTDVYALGVLLFQMLTGRLPFESPDPGEMERQHLDAPPPPPSAFAPVSPAVERLLLSALAKRAEQRPASARELFDSLRRSGGGAGPAAAQPGIVLSIEVLTESELPSDALLDEIAGFMEQARERLEAARYLIVVETATDLLAARPRGEPAAAVELANDLATVVPAGSPISIGVHVGELRVDHANGEVDGPALDLGGARAEARTAGVWLSAAARRALASE